MQSGETCEIFTSKVEGAGPSRDWLQFVHTPRARSKIRQWFSRERRVDAIDAGRDELVKALRREGMPVQKLASSAAMSKVAAQLNYADLDTLYAAIGEHHLSAKAVVQRVQRDLRGGEEQLPVTVARPPRAPGRSRGHGDVGVHVEGLDDVMVRLSRCCTPVPGDEIMGFVTRGRGVSVHRTDCANAAQPAYAERSGHRCRMGQRRARELRRVGGDRGAGPVPAAPRRRRRAVGAPREHHRLHVTDAGRPHRSAALRFRARRSRPPALDLVGREAGRFRVRSDTGAARARV